MTTSLTTSTQKGQALHVANTIKNGMRAARRVFPERGGLSVYEPQPTDIIVTTFPKAGTTLMQQLVYQTAVLTGGAAQDDESGENFSDISDKVPWINYIHLPSAQPEHYSMPRIFKTHSPAWRFNVDKQRHIVIIRNPLRFPVSWLDFSFGCFPHLSNEHGNDTVKKLLFDDVIKRLIIGRFETDGDRLSERDDETDAFWSKVPDGLGPWFAHTKGWVYKIGHRNLLMLSYEDVVGNPDVVIDVVAKFMQRNIDHGRTALVKERCSKEYMQKDNRFKSVWGARVLGIDAGSSKVLSENGRHGFDTIDIEKDQLEEIKRQMRLAFGCETYEQLRDIVLKKQNLYGLFHK